MINNSRRNGWVARTATAVLALASLLAVSGGCRGRAAEVDPQGVVELDERLVAFEVPGRVDEVAVMRGDRVKKGDVVAEVDATLEKLSRDTRAGEAKAAKADLALLEAGSRREDVASLEAQLRAISASEGLLAKSRDRARQLVSSGSLPQAELDRAEAELARVENEKASLEQRLAAMHRGARPEEIARLRARAEAAATALALADARLERYAVRAMIDGEILDVHVQRGELAAAGVPVATIADVAHPFVDVFVPQADLAGIAVGKRASVRVDGAPAQPGVVEHVASRTEFTPRYVFTERERPNLVVRVRVRMEDPEHRLHAGAPAFVKLER